MKVDEAKSSKVKGKQKKLLYRSVYSTSAVRDKKVKADYPAVNQPKMPEQQAIVCLCVSVWVCG